MGDSYIMDEINKENALNGLEYDSADEPILEEETDNSVETVKKLRGKLKVCETDKNEYLTGWQRAKADFINARREEEERRSDIIKFSETSLLLELINLADNFDRLTAAKDELTPTADKNWRQGVEMTRSQLISILKSRKVEATQPLEKLFDPKECESIGEVTVDSEEKDGIVIEESRKGYKMSGKIIRPSLVKVGKFIKK